MAADGICSNKVDRSGVPSFRLYTWSGATVSLGYFQRETPEIEPNGDFAGLPAVRRLSGGGAILHHHELTYSCCVPAAHPYAEQPSLLYDRMHQRICDVFAEFGIVLGFRGESEGAAKPFLCFSRGDRRDLVYRGFKVVGSAQRRRGRAVLQHGSILLRRSPFAPQFPGIFNLSEKDVDVAALRQRLETHCGRLLGDSLRTDDLSAEELEAIRALRSERYLANMPGHVS
ncbi:MAG: biotin/lipoate A/B protein ligase family protein [Planctomycetaceae bacterium]